MLFIVIVPSVFLQFCCPLWGGERETTYGASVDIFFIC